MLFIPSERLVRLIVYCPDICLSPARLSTATRHTKLMTEYVGTDGQPVTLVSGLGRVNAGTLPLLLTAFQESGSLVELHGYWHTCHDNEEEAGEEAESRA